MTKGDPKMGRWGMDILELLDCRLGQREVRGGHLEPVDKAGVVIGEQRLFSAAAAAADCLLHPDWRPTGVLWNSIDQKVWPAFSRAEAPNVIDAIMQLFVRTFIQCFI